MSVGKENRMNNQHEQQAVKEWMSVCLFVLLLAVKVKFKPLLLSCLLSGLDSYL